MDTKRNALTWMPSRRALLLGAVAPALMPGLGLDALAQTPRQGAPPRKTPGFFLTEAEERLLTALVDRIIPRDEWPSASEAGVVDFFDFQLTTDWGHGQGLYRKGPHTAGNPRQGYQLPYTPSEFYRRALADKALAGFEGLAPAAQDALLTRLEKNELSLGDIPGGTFFTILRQNTLDGYFSDPIHGGNRDMASWRMIGFPGAHAYYITEIDRFELDYARPPAGVAYRTDGVLRGVAQTARGR